MKDVKGKRERTWAIKGVAAYGGGGIETAKGLRLAGDSLTINMTQDIVTAWKVGRDMARELASAPGMAGRDQGHGYGANARAPLAAYPA